MTRRQLLAGAAAAARLSAVPRSQMGIATTSYMTAARPRDTYAFLEHVHALGGAGIQASLSSTEPAYLRKLRDRASELGMYVEVMAGLPDKDNPAAFERTVAAAKEAGATCLRSACLGGRRYETFKSLVDWQRFITTSRDAIDRALPVLEKQRIPLALENHKDWTAEEMTALMRNRGGEWLGVCLDTGNNISLLDDPIEVVESLAPFAVATHIKDMAVEPYAEGFLLSEMPLGEGMLDMKRIVDTIRRARPRTRFTLEMITRDPLQVPCLADRYWTTFPDRPGSYLARALRTAAGHKNLPRLAHLSPDHLRSLEEENVKQCLNYAREQLGL